jgi:hypothetical protein
MSDWRQDPAAVRDLRRRLEARKRELQKEAQFSDDHLDAALGASDPIEALNRLAIRPLEVQTLDRGIARLVAIENDLKIRAATHQRNLRAHHRLSS